MKNIKIKVLLLSAIFMIGIGITTLSQAFTVCEGEEGVKRGHFYPHEINGEGMFYCINWGGTYKASLSRSQYNSYSPGHTTGYVCQQDGSPSAPWDGGLTYMRYAKGSRLSEIANQDATYVLADIDYNYDTAEQDQVWETAYAMWSSGISSPKIDLGTELGAELAAESQAYKTFYESTHINGRDIYTDLLKNNTVASNVKVSVNKAEGSYTVGPFNISYPQGFYKEEKFSWINYVTATDQAGKEIGSTKQDATNKIQILSKGGVLVYDTDKDKNQLNVPKSGEDFYIKIYSKTATAVVPKFDFGYLESCSAEMYEYNGNVIERYWEKESASCGHREWCSNHQKYHDKSDRKVRFRLNETTRQTSQKLMAHVGKATKNYKTTTLTLKERIQREPTKPGKPDEPEGMDLRMHISGKVFLDKDEGKVNEGNNRFDNGEGLEGTEVTLYDTEHNQIDITLTNNEGYYEFTGLNAQKTYYVKFTYNGILYTNVLYNKNGDDTSKATEEGQGHNGARESFNSLFTEIGSYPANYKVKNDIFGLGYNRTYLQEEVADVFKAVAKKVVELNGDELAAYRAVAGSSSEMKSKVQFVADCRIRAYTVETYALPNEFVIDSFNQVVAGKGYAPIYSGVYNQTNVNLGMKARPTFDLALYKDVFNAVVDVNGKSEIYTYDARKDKEHKGFNFGVNEGDYLNQLRDKYMNNKNTDMTTKETQEDISYTQELRSEEIINGNNGNTNINSDTLFDSDKNYAWRDVNHQLNEQDKLKIHVTYKLAIRNQSGITGSVTEVVDYYDNNYNLEGVYVGDEDGNKIEGTKVEVSTESMYANRGDTMFDTEGKYKTVYLRPTEQKLGNAQEQYIFITFGLINPESTLVNAKLMDGEKLYAYNVAEINGYKTYDMGLIDKDSNPGNLDIADYERGITKMEDDENQAPAFIWSKRYSRTVEGSVFEDTITSTKKPEEVATKQNRFGSGTIDEKDKAIKDVIVELVEVKQVGDQKQLIVRQATRTDEKGWYGFGSFLPGDYVIRYTYGSDNQTAMTKETPNIKGTNATSYNGQDYQSTQFATKQGENATVENYNVDDILKQRYDMNNKNKNQEEKVVNVDNQKITKYSNNAYYWYADSAIANKSDATDDIARKGQVIDYAKNEYAAEIVNHKAEVFNSYSNPQPDHISKETHSKLVSELERRTYRYAYTAELPVEIEYTTKTITGNQTTDKYTYKMTGVDFGVVERPKAKLELTKKVDHIKVTAADGTTVLFDTDKGVNNLSWIVRKDRYQSTPPIQIIMDDELISGAKLEITYKFTVTNNGELDENGNSTTRAKKIIDYVANNLTYTKEDGENNLWQVVKKEDIQNDKNATLINNSQNGKYKLIDLSTKQTILQTTDKNPLTKALKAGESVSSTLVLKKVLSTESSTDDLTYRNIAEIVEIDNTVGRYDHSSVPGNQLPDGTPTEDDTYEAETIIVIPPFGSQPMYYVLGIFVAVVLAGGIYLIKRKVVGK